MASIEQPIRRIAYMRVKEFLKNLVDVRTSLVAL